MGMDGWMDGCERQKKQVLVSLILFESLFEHALKKNTVFHMQLQHKIKLFFFKSFRADSIFFFFDKT